MAFLGFPIIAFGSFAMIYNKYVHDAPHFTTWHAVRNLPLSIPVLFLFLFFYSPNNLKLTHHQTFGLITIIWLVIHASLGATSVWAPSLFGGVARAKAIWKYHRISGYLLLPFMFLTAHLAGAWSTWVVMNTSYADRVITYTILPIVILVGVFVRVR
jgi:cytochrome b-561 domain containing protein 2